MAAIAWSVGRSFSPTEFRFSARRSVVFSASKVRTPVGDSEPWMGNPLKSEEETLSKVETKNHNDVSTLLDFKTPHYNTYFMMYNEKTNTRVPGTVTTHRYINVICFIAEKYCEKITLTVEDCKKQSLIEEYSLSLCKPGVIIRILASEKQRINNTILPLVKRGIIIRILMLCKQDISGRSLQSCKTHYATRILPLCQIDIVLNGWLFIEPKYFQRVVSLCEQDDATRSLSLNEPNFVNTSLPLCELNYVTRNLSFWEPVYFTRNLSLSKPNYVTRGLSLWEPDYVTRSWPLCEPDYVTRSWSLCEPDYVTRSLSLCEPDYVTRSWSLCEPDYVTKSLSLRERDYVTRSWSLWEPDYVTRNLSLREPDYVTRSWSLCEPDYVTRSWSFCEPDNVTRSLSLCEPDYVTRSLSLCEPDYVTIRLSQCKPDNVSRRLSLCEPDYVTRSLSLCEPDNVTRSLSLCEPDYVTRSLSLCEPDYVTIRLSLCKPDNVSRRLSLCEPDYVNRSLSLWPPVFRQTETKKFLRNLVRKKIYKNVGILAEENNVDEQIINQIQNYLLSSGCKNVFGILNCIEAGSSELSNFEHNIKLCDVIIFVTSSLSISERMKYYVNIALSNNLQSGQSNFITITDSVENLEILPRLVLPLPTYLTLCNRDGELDEVIQIPNKVKNDLLCLKSEASQENTGKCCHTVRQGIFVTKYSILNERNNLKNGYICKQMEKVCLQKKLAPVNGSNCVRYKFNIMSPVLLNRKDEDLLNSKIRQKPFRLKVREFKNVLLDENELFMSRTIDTVLHYSNEFENLDKGQIQCILQTISNGNMNLKRNEFYKIRIVSDEVCEAEKIKDEILSKYEHLNIVINTEDIPCGKLELLETAENLYKDDILIIIHSTTTCSPIVHFALLYAASRID